MKIGERNTAWWTRKHAQTGARVAGCHRRSWSRASTINNRASWIAKLVSISKSGVDLESRARAYAEAGIRNEAYNRGILKIAADNAEKRIAELLLAAGYKKVRFESRSGVRLGG